jgi:hypothetical protein
MEASGSDEEEERVPAGPPASGQRRDFETSPPGVAMPNEPPTRPADTGEESEQPAEDVPEADESAERGDE